MAQGYVIYCNYGEYDDYVELPLFFCPIKFEADLFLEALNNKEKPYYDKVIEFFKKRHAIGAKLCENEQEFADMYLPRDLGFGYHPVEVLTLMEQHHAT